MSRKLRMRNAAGQNVRVEVTDEAAGMLAHEGRQKHQTKVLELAAKIDPEPTDEDVKRRMREANLSYADAAQHVFTEWEERKEKRERELSTAGAVEVTDENIRERVARTGEDYAVAARALAIEIGGM